MDCASFLGGKTTLTHCIFAQFYPFDGNRGAALRISNHLGDKEYALQSFDIVNSLITGYADDVVMVDNRDNMMATISLILYITH